VSTIAERLATRTLELVDIPSPSRREEAIVRHVARLVPHEELQLAWDQDDVLLYLPRSRREGPLVLLAGHFDTVPAQGNLPGRIEDGAVVGLGASDMKGGLAVMVELARSLAASGRPGDLSLALLFFGREELPAGESPLPRLLRKTSLHADLVIMLEPTDNQIQLGCLGNLNAELKFTGTSAHSARPWLGENAIARAIEGLEPLIRIEPLDVEVGGLIFREVLSVTAIGAGVAANVIPDLAIATLNFRYAPNRTPEEAVERLRELVAEAGELTLRGHSAPARVAVDSPLVRRLRDAGDFTVAPKQAWTPVAEFSAHGLDAVNLGPGATRYAHRRDERIEIDALVMTYTALQRFLGATV